MDERLMRVINLGKQDEIRNESGDLVEVTVDGVGDIIIPDGSGIIIWRRGVRIIGNWESRIQFVNGHVTLVLDKKLNGLEEEA